MRAGAIALIVGLALVGCAAPPAPSVPPPSPSPTLSTPSSSGLANASPTSSGPANCGDFLATPEDVQQVLYPGEAEAVLTDSGAEMLTESQRVLKWCAEAGPEAALFGFPRDFGTKTPECADLLEQKPSVQARWVKVYFTYAGTDRVPSLDEALDLCRLDKWSSFMDLFDWLDASRATWATETKLGFTQTNTIEVEDMMSGGDIVHPDSGSSGDFRAGDGCGFDADHDVAIPIRLTAENTTEAEESPLRARFNLRVTENSGELITSAHIESSYSDGAGCSNTASQSVAEAIVDVSWKEAVASGDSARSRHFVIVENYFSPRHPSGAADELNHYELSGSVIIGAEDPIRLIRKVPVNLGVAN